MDSSVFDTLFRDEQGNIVIAQPPNLSLSTWIGASLLQLVFTEGPINSALEIIALTAILVWALQEMFEGVNYFRRGLGLIVLIIAIAAKILELSGYL